MAMMNNMTLYRLQQEYTLCTQDNDLIQIGCNFGLENNNVFTWRVTMIGPRNTPYDGGLFTILVTFPNDYPNHGPSFKFLNKIYHLNVNFTNFQSKDEIGHICINNLNSWKSTGNVKDKPFYTVKQALFDIFCLFYNQGTESPYDEGMAELYKNNPLKFNENAKQWTQLYASMQ